MTSGKHNIIFIKPKNTLNESLFWPDKKTAVILVVIFTIIRRR